MAKTWRSYREESKVLNIGESVEERYRVCNDQIKLGAILRIADATEAMAKDYIELKSDRDKYQKWYREEREYKRAAYRRIAALKGVITKLKKKV